MKQLFTKAIKLTCLFISSIAISQEVNPFTGALNYGAPLLSVPSDRGNSIPINVSYGGNGISVSQPASEVGLGWGLSAGGSIIRSVSGIPDDFNGAMFNQTTKTFDSQRGILSSSGPTSYDILSSRRNLDSTVFYYPNYDMYGVSGPGIGGSMTPMILNYMAFTKNTDGQFEYSSDISGVWKKPEFMFNGDFSDTLISRHYPSTPVDIYTPFKIPKDIVTGDYHNDATPYFGKKGNGLGAGENYDQTTNRLGTSNYVEYTTDSYGINAFKITNSAGFVYYYDLPIYSNSTINYSYPLNNNYSMPRYTANHTYTTDPKIGSGNYFVEHSYEGNNGTYITEVKEENKIPVEWKLTAITGPDYIDVSPAGFDSGDKGYWVVFEYKKWTDHFYNRYPTLGFNYSFGLDDKTQDYPISDSRKRSGKLAVATLSDEEVYYLNSINTSSHKAIFVRDVRNDEVSAIPNYDAALNDSILINQPGVVTAWHGKIFDEGGPSAGYSSCVSYTSNAITTEYVKTIQVGDISSLVLKFNSLNLNKFFISGSSYKYDRLHIYAGPTTSSPEISFTYTGTSYTSPFSPNINSPSTVPLGVEITINNYTATAITIKVEKQCIGVSQYPGTGFDLEWHAVSNKRMPQLNVKRVLLFDNRVTYSSPFTGINSITTANSNFNFLGTTASSSPPYNEIWFQANKTAIDAVTLKGNELVYDYSLANKYHKNINVIENKTTRLSTPSSIQSNLSVNTVTVGTGKLTLNKIIPFELGGVQLYPTLKFDYNSSIPTDNPDYDPRSKDYWGYYKSDISNLGYYGYTSSSSKDYTDAWMLRKIISPMSGVTELEYESNTYTKVLKGNGGFKGPSKIYPIEKLVSGNVYLEEGTNLPADLSAVYNATASGVYTSELFVPFIGTPYDPTDPSVQISNVFGSFTYTSAVLPLNPLVNGYLTDASIGNPVFASCIPTGSGLSLNSYTGGYEYTGNGWIRFTMPVGTNLVYGAGSRVKNIINKNGTSDAYKSLYEYEGGVALAEADRFTNPLARYPSHGQCAVHEKLNLFGTDPYDLHPSIGYSKVITKNLGQVNAAKGWTEIYFNTSDLTDKFNFEIDNFKTNLGGKTVFTSEAPSTYTVPGYTTITTCSRQDTGLIVEYVDKFSSYWGLTKEQRVYDVNSNMLSRNVYEYETTEQGALVENFVFATAVVTYTGPPNPYFIEGGEAVWHDNGSIPVWHSPCDVFEATNASWQACIKRLYPAVLKKTTSYGMGTKSITETLKRDELTGESTITQVKGDNNTSALSIQVPAFRISTFANMGAKSVNSSYKNMLGADAYYYSVVDSSLTGTPGSASPNFSGASASVYSQSTLTRGYNAGTNTYTNTSVTQPYWFNKSSYNWVGAVGSIDTYGLYKKSELSANPFNFSSPSSSNSKWRFGGEITLMDTKGHSIETRGFNNKFSATKLDFTGKYVLSQITNCNYLSFTYSGFEHYSVTGTTDGELLIPSGTSSIIIAPGYGGFFAHTGKYIAQVYAGGMGPNYSVAYNGTGSNGEELGLLRDRVYRASVWVMLSSSLNTNLKINLTGNIGGVSTNQTVTMNVTDAKAVIIGDWKLLYVDIKVPANYTSPSPSTDKLTAYVDVTTTGTAYIDDFQLHPIESSVSSKVYDANGRITAEIDAEGYATKYTYDAAGRITATYQEIPGVGLKLIKTNTYNYARGTN